MNRGAVIRFAVSLLIAIPAAVAQNALEIIALRHRTAEQVIPALQPLLEPGATLSGQSAQLFVRASPANLAELRRALDSIDRPQKRLLISVRFDDAFDAASRGIEASGRNNRIDIHAQDSRSRGEERTIGTSREGPIRAPRTIDQGPGRSAKADRKFESEALT